MSLWDTRKVVRCSWRMKSSLGYTAVMISRGQITDKLMYHDGHLSVMLKVCRVMKAVKAKK